MSGDTVFESKRGIRRNDGVYRGAGGCKVYIKSSVAGECVDVNSDEAKVPLVLLWCFTAEEEQVNGC